MYDHASFFSGVGGLDLGLERAGWRTVSFSEIDPYASAVLAERWPGVPNLGDILALVHVPTDELGAGFRDPRDGRGESCDGGWSGDGQSGRGRIACGCTIHEDRGERCLEPITSLVKGFLCDRCKGVCWGWTSHAYRYATLWTGGFPCQDLSVAGKRAGFAGERSSLAFAFLDLVERHRPPAVLLENVPGLLSSHRGRDMATLTGRMAELGYGVAYRVLDARHFGVPQRRRRVFILGLRSGPDDPSGRLAALRAAAVLSVGTRCNRHPPSGVEAGSDAPGGAPSSVVGSLSTSESKNQQEAYVGHLLAEFSPSPDPGGVRAADGLAGRLDDRLMGSLREHVSGEQRTTDLNVPLVVGFSENQRGEVVTHEQAHQLTSGGGKPGQGYSAVLGASGMTADDPLLPLGLDSHRYRCCGNGVVAPVAEWLGARLRAAL